MATSVGGGATAPTPAWLLRAALASCDATLVAMEAARDGVELTDLEVTVDSDSDFRGILGVDDSVDPGPLKLRVRIQLAASNATEDQLRAIVERAESRSPVRDVVARGIPMTTEIAIGVDSSPPRTDRDRGSLDRGATPTRCGRSALAPGSSPFRGALQLRADVDQDRAIVVGRVRLSGRQAIELRPRLIEQLLDCQLGFGIGAHSTSRTRAGARGLEPFASSAG
jgi:uncharacterized OsmC-like protein